MTKKEAEALKYMKRRKSIESSVELAQAMAVTSQRARQLLGSLENQGLVKKIPQKWEIV